MSVLQTIDLKKYYGTKPNITRALDGVNFSVNAGTSPMRNCMTTSVCKKPDGHFMESSGCILESNKPIKI